MRPLTTAGKGGTHPGSPGRAPGGVRGWAKQRREAQPGKGDAHPAETQSSLEQFRYHAPPPGRELGSDPAERPRSPGVRPPSRITRREVSDELEELARTAWPPIAPPLLPGPRPSRRRAERLRKVWAQISCCRASFTAQMHLEAAWPPADPPPLSCHLPSDKSPGQAIGSP